MKPESQYMAKPDENLRQRTRQFALRIIRLYSALPKSAIGQIIGKQLLRSGTSVGAHYAESCRSKSHPDFVNKIEGAMQELEETSYWLELIEEARILPARRLSPLKTEIDEITAIFVTMVKKAKQHMREN
jgi:four helix bundle protein